MRIVLSALAISIGLFLIFSPTTPAVADGLFVGAIALVLALYVWPGVSSGTARLVALVLMLLAAYAVIRGFGLLELAFVRQVGGVAAILIGVVLLVPSVRAITRSN